MSAASPLVTVVIPAYGAEEFIEHTMRSVATQTHRPMELIVVEDCSPDRTSEIAESVAAAIAEPDFTVRVEHHDVNRGGAAALRTGFDLAAGDFVCWLSADDAYVLPEKTANQVATMLAGADLTFDTHSRIGPTPETATLAEHHWGNRKYRASDDTYLIRPTWRLLSLNFANPINGSSVMIRRETLEQCGSFDPTLRNIDQDSDMWLRLTALGARFRSTNETGVFYRIHPGQTSNLTEEVDAGVTLTRVRVLLALARTGDLRRVLNRAWPVLILTRPGLFVHRPLVAQVLCALGSSSGCGPVPRLLLAGLRREFVRRGMWDEDGLARALADAEESSRSDEFQLFLERLRSRKGHL